MKATFNVKTHPKPTTAWPFTLPASGMRGPISDTTLQLTCDSVPYHSTSYWEAILSAWCSNAVSLIKDHSGKVVDVIYYIFGGGHSDSMIDGVYAWRASTGKFETMIANTKWAFQATPILPYCEITPGRPDTQHTYQHVYGLDSDEPNGPALMNLSIAAAGLTTVGYGQAHRFDGTLWSRWATNVITPNPNGPIGFIKDTKRKLFFGYQMETGNTCSLAYDSATPTWNCAAAPYGGTWDNGFYACGVYDPIGDLYLLGPGSVAGDHTQMFVADASSPSAVLPLNVSGTGPQSIGVGLQYRKLADEFLLIPTIQPAPLFKLKPPASNRKTGVWTWTTQTFGGPPSNVFSGTTAQSHNKWQYIEVFDALIGCPGASWPMECWKL